MGLLGACSDDAEHRHCSNVQGRCGDNVSVYVCFSGCAASGRENKGKEGKEICQTLKESRIRCGTESRTQIGIKPLSL